MVESGDDMSAQAPLVGSGDPTSVEAQATVPEAMQASVPSPPREASVSGVDQGWLEAVDEYVVTCRACMTVQWRDAWRPGIACPAGHALCRPCYAMFMWPKPLCPVCRRDIFRITGQSISPVQLETADKAKFTCPVCLLVLEHPAAGLFFFFTLVTGPGRSLSLKLSDTRVYGPQIRARLGTTAHFCEVLNPKP